MRDEAPNEETRLSGEETGSQLSLDEATKPQGTTRPRQKSPTQRDKVLRWLMAEEAVCSTTFLARYVPRAAAHVHALRNLGYVITTRLCTRPGHDHATHQIEYVLEAVPFDPSGGAA